MPIPFTRLGNPEVQNASGRALRELLGGLLTPLAARQLPAGGNGGTGRCFAALDDLVQASTPTVNVGQGGANAPETVAVGTWQLGGHHSPVARMGDTIGLG